MRKHAYLVWLLYSLMWIDFARMDVHHGYWQGIFLDCAMAAALNVAFVVSYFRQEVTPCSTK